MALTPLDFPPSPTDGQTYPNPPVTGQPTYQWDAATGVWLSKFALGEEYVQLDGGQPMTGLLTLSGNPTAPMHAATKSYVDSTEKGRKNYIINGAMQISQENGATAVTTSGAYPADMFFIITSGTTGTFNFQNMLLSSPAGSTSRLRLTVTTADAAVAAGDVVYLGQRIEGLRACDLNYGIASAKTATLQFGVKAPAGTYCISFGNHDQNRYYIAEYVIAAGEANTDVVKSVTIPGDVTGAWEKTTNNGLRVHWGLMAGTTWQQAAGAWGTTVGATGSTNQFNLFGTNGNVFELFDVSLTEGSAAPPFQVPDYASELALCKRYFEKVVNFKAGYTANTTANSVSLFSSFTVEKRGTPTAALFLAGTPANFNSTAYSPSVYGIVHSGNAVAAGNYTIDYILKGTARL